jgi:LCP family protein required for cell wall assembly
VRQEDEPGRVYRARPRLFRRNEPLAGPPFLPAGGGAARGGLGAPPGAWLPPDDRGRRGPGAPPAVPPPVGPPGGSVPPPGRTRPRLRWWWIVLPLAVLLVAYPLVLFATAWSSLHRVDALSSSGPADTPGRTYLVVGSDSRADLTAAERRALHTGQAAGRRTDTLMLLHVPDGGGPTVLVSVPRDSYVSIPGHGKNKVNAAYSFGGAPLLVRTVEQATGLRIDSYVETGLGGYARLVDAIGGVDVCVKRAIKDSKANIDVKAGCQTFDGATALGYARARYSDPRGDLGRVERQRQVLAAIAGKALSPFVVLLPWRSFPAASNGGDALTVDSGMSPLGLLAFVRAMRAVAGGDGLSLTVPIGNAALRTPAGEAVQWNGGQAKQLFDALRSDDTDAVKRLADAQKKTAGG